MSSIIRVKTNNGEEELTRINYGQSPISISPSGALMVDSRVAYSPNFWQRAEVVHEQSEPNPVSDVQSP